MTAFLERRWAPFVVIVIVALALREALLPTARFGGDEALFFGIGMDIVELKRWPLLGTQLTDGDAKLFGPTFLYVMALPLVFFRGPEAQYLFTEILGALSVGVFFLALRRPFGSAGAFFAALLMALSPWSALYADRTWNPHILLVVEMCALWCALDLRRNPASRALIAFVPLCAVMPHFHMSAPVAWAGLGVLVLPTIRRWDRRALAIGLALAALLYVPLAVHELETGFGNTRAFLAETLGEKKEHHPTSFLWIPVYALRFLTLDVTYHELTGYWGGPDELKCLRALWTGTPPRPFHVLRVFAFVTSLVLALTAITVSARAAWQRWRADRAVPWFALAFLAALATNLVLLGSSGKQVFGHYVTNLLPFVFVAYASLGASLSGSLSGSLASPSASSGSRSGSRVGSPHSSGVFRALVLAGALVFCLGGIEATLSVSRNVDGRIGLAVHRKTLEVIRADGERDGNSGESVRLDFGYRSNLYDWHLFATRALDMPIHFDPRAPRAYRLVERGAPPPRGPVVAGPIDVGSALLYRVR